MTKVDYNNHFCQGDKTLQKVCKECNEMNKMEDKKEEDKVIEIKEGLFNQILNQQERLTEVVEKLNQRVDKVDIIKALLKDTEINLADEIKKPIALNRLDDIIRVSLTFEQMNNIQKDAFMDYLVKKSRTSKGQVQRFLKVAKEYLNDLTSNLKEK
jgi:hypothetical protein